MEVATSLATKVSDLLFGAAIREIGYMWNCSQNVETLKEEVEKLKEMMKTLQQRIDPTKETQELENWINKLDGKINEATNFIKEEAETTKTCCDLPFCVNLGTLHHYGKMATENTNSLLQLKTEGEHFRNCVFDPLPKAGFKDLYEAIDLQNIYTQKSTLEEIIQAVKDEPVVGIVGIGGVGKTTLAKQAGVKMKDKFAHIQIIEVTQNINKEMIKEDLQVASTIIKNQKDAVLIILDDMWEELKLDEVGIPFGSAHPNCKILLTSRNKSVCDKMNAKIINLNPLREIEAWTLFQRMVGKGEWDKKLKEVALKIVEECGGLPLFIQAVGKALKNKEFGIWKAMLDTLQDSTDMNVRFKKEGILQLKVSYDLLESQEAKSCFLLCSMFPENATIDLERLIYYGLALRIFSNPDCDIQKAKYRVLMSVDSLKSSSLLLEESKNSFKMHDLVRDMASLITSEGNDKFHVQSGRRLREWQPKKYLESYNKISVMRNRISKLSNHELVFPHLDTFLIQDNRLDTIPDEFFRAMQSLKLLDVSGNRISSLPQSLSDLTKLHTLDLSRNTKLNEISILGLLTCLEILLLRGTGIKNIPDEIGQLTNLMLLDVYFCEDLCYVTPGVISKLIRLEQLYVGLEEGNCNFLLELSGSLKILHLKVPDLRYIPKDAHFETLTELLIEDEYVTKDPMEDMFVINDDIFKNLADDYKITLRILRSRFPFTLPIMKLIKVSEMLILRGIGMDNVLPDLSPKGCEKLKYMELQKCNDVRSLMKTYDLDVMQTSTQSGQMGVFSRVENVKLYDVNRLELIGDTPNQYIRFCNLAKIKISNCCSLLELFPLSVAQTLVNLRYLEITDCDNLVVVISSRDEQTSRSKTEIVKQEADVVFPLTSIILGSLPKLESFYSGYSTIKYPSLGVVFVCGCASMKRWSYGETHIPNIIFEMKRTEYSNINNYIAAQLEVSGEMEIIDMSNWDSISTTGGYPSSTRKPSMLQRRVMKRLQRKEGERIAFIAVNAVKRYIDMMQRKEMGGT